MGVAPIVQLRRNTPMPASKYKRGEPTLKTNIPDSVRTPGKDDAAEYIQDNVIEKGRWPMDLTDIANEAGWSRQHIANTLDTYFTFKDNGQSEPKPETVALSGDRTPDRLAEDVVHLEIPPDIANPEEYVRGWFAGWLSRDDQT